MQERDERRHVQSREIQTEVETREATPTPRTPVAEPGQRTREWLREHEHRHEARRSTHLLDASRDRDVVIGERQNTATYHGVMIQRATLWFAAHERVRILPPQLVAMRHSLGQLQRGDEVLARWSDEGWYYQGNDHDEPVCDSLSRSSLMTSSRFRDRPRKLW